jgi:AcrR family transcriptional regulator
VSVAQAENIRYEPAVRRPRSAETRARLLRSALLLFRERGYHGAGTNEIGAAAGMTGPSIYRHFATKDDLLVAAVLEAADRLGVEAAAALHEADAQKSLAMLCTSFVGVSLDDPEMVCVYFYESRHLSEEARASMDASANRYLAHYQRLVAELLPSVSDEEILVRVVAAWHMVAGMCTDLPDVPIEILRTTLTQRMLVTLLSDNQFDRRVEATN